MQVHHKSYGRGRPLVFFHGWGYDHQIWSSLIPFLQETHQLILVDLPGFGRTPMMDNQTFKVALLKQLPLRFVLIGWSMGGLYATRLALEEPHRVEALFNISSSPCFVGDKMWPGIDKKIFHDFYRNFAKDGKKAWQEFMAWQGGTVLDSRITHEGLEEGLNVLGTWDLREEIKNCHLVTGFLFGLLDPIVPAKTLAVMQQRYPTFQYFLCKKAAHLPFLSHREWFIKTLLGFLSLSSTGP